MENQRVSTAEPWVVGIGSSAGGLEALTQFVSALPRESRACFVVTQHLAPHSRSMMVELISRHSPIPVDVVSDEQELVTNRLFIVPPNHDVEIKSGKLLLTVAGDETRPKPSVDRFFTSLARERGERSIGVILSGTGSDGSDGTRAIKAAGGITIAQEEATAKYSGMPNAALETGNVDYILSPPEIARKISDIVNSDSPNPVADNPDAGPSFDKILKLVRREVGNDFSQYKLPTIRRRLAKRMFARGTESIDEYYESLRTDEKEVRELAQEFLVSVTSFFRDAEAFQKLSELISERISKLTSNEEIRVWSAGCATGEEAYSLAMIICEHVEKTGRKNPIKIFATDLDTDAISKARLGIYSEREVEGLSRSYLERFFDKKGDRFEVKKSVRDNVIFARQDLAQSPPFVKLDLICCRNVIIYFEPKLQQRLFEIFSYALKSGGLLFLGKSEAIVGVVDTFEPVDKKLKIFVKKASAPRAMPSVVRLAPQIDMALARKKIAPAASPIHVAQIQMLERHGIAGALVNADGIIQNIIGDVSPYLKIPSGLDSFSVQSLLPKSAAVEFQLLLRKTIKSKALEASRPFKNFDKADYFVIKASPLESSDGTNAYSPDLILVTFEMLLPAESSVQIAPSKADGDLALRAAELEQELHATKEHLQTVIEELGVANEELQSTNEELSSTNEELQSSNEELETTNEEFQSTNEELSTLNEELNVKSTDLRFAIADLENIQSSIGIPLIVVDQDLTIQRFNPNSTELFDISFADIGRSLARIPGRCEIASFTQKISRVIETGIPDEAVVEAYRAVYQMRISPRRDDQQRIVGAIICFFNNTEIIQAEQRIRKSEAQARGIINGTSSIIFIKDMNGRYLSVNEAFLNKFRLEEKSVLGKTDRDIFAEPFANQLRDGDLEAAARRSRVEKEEKFPTAVGDGVFLVSRFPLTEEPNANPYAVGTVAVDITAQIETKAALERSETLYRGVVEDQAVFVVRFDPSGKIIFVNSAFARYFGGSISDYIGQPFTTIIDGSDRSYVNEELCRLTASNPITQVEHRNSRFGNSIRWIRWINKAVVNDKNELIEIQAVGFDVTEYRLQTDQMVQREMLFSNIFTYTTDFLTVFRVSASGDLLLESFNRNAEDGGNYGYAQFIGRSVKELVSSQYRDEILAKYKACVDLKEPQNFDEEIIIQGSTKYLSTTVIPVVNNTGRVERVVALSRDISKYKVAQAELNAAKAAAEIANESKSDFLASMSHELRSPLNVVIGMAELLESADLGKQERDQVKSIRRSGKVLLTLIEEILDISKIEAGKTKLEFSNFSISELVSDVVEAFALQAREKKIKLVVKQPAGSPDDFVGDANRIRQILVNLVSNAVKFTDKGKVEILVSSVGHLTTGRRLVRFDVNDTGIGIPEEDHSRLFKKFSQVDSGLGRRYGGTGLGLVISQRLTTLMNGQIGFTSTWGKGSSFWFELPLTIARTPNMPKIKKEIKLTPVPSVRARILAVDDSADSRMLLQMLLKRLGHDSVIVDGGEAALQAVQKGSYDMILMDVQMPGLDGYQTTRLIRKLKHPNSNLPIIAFTANAMVGDSEKCFEAGMNDYLTKPINVDTLRTKIAKWACHDALDAPDTAPLSD